MTNSKDIAVSKNNIIPAFLASIIDICLVFMVYFVAYLGFSKIPRISNLYQSHQLEAIKYQDQAKIDFNLGYKIYKDNQEYEVKYKDYPVYKDDLGDYKVVNYDAKDITEENVKKYQQALNSNTDYGHERFMVALLSYEIRLFAFAVSSFLLIFLIPFISKKRYTVGRLSTKCELISVSRTFEASRWQILGRFLFILIVTALLGIYLNPILVLLILIATTSLMYFINKSGRTIRDYVTGTKVIYNNLEQK